jgi:hypothetical protein
MSTAVAAPRTRAFPFKWLAEIIDIAEKFL